MYGCVRLVLNPLDTISTILFIRRAILSPWNTGRKHYDTKDQLYFLLIQCRYNASTSLIASAGVTNLVEPKITVLSTPLVMTLRCNLFDSSAVMPPMTNIITVGLSRGCFVVRAFLLVSILKQ